MNLLLEITIKVSLIVGLGLCAALFLRRRSAALRHLVLTAAIVGAAFSPLLGPIVPSWSISPRIFSPAPDRQQPRAVAGATAPVGEPSIALFSTGGAALTSGRRAFAGIALLTVPRVLASIWIAGALVSLSVLLIGAVRLKRLASDARPIERGRWVELGDEIRAASGLRRPSALLQSNHPTLLVTWGLMRPKILIPTTADRWTDERVRIVLRHELAHVQRGDWLVQMTAEVLRCLYWFNPLVWMACRRLRQESEHACDDAVLSDGIAGPDYAAHLLELARTLNAERRTWLPAPAMARPSSLEGRITAMLNARMNRSPVTRSARVGTILVALLVAASVAGAQTSFFTFSGTIIDATNRVLPNTVLGLTNDTSQAKYEVHSDTTGHFEFVGLPSGKYSLEVKMAGFSTLKDAIAIAGQSVDRTLTMYVGSLEETITVNPSTAAKPPLSLSPERLEAIHQSAHDKVQGILDKCATGGSGPVGGHIVPPLKIVDMRPIYPEQLNGSTIGGIVTLDALIGTDGNVEDVRVVSSPYPDLESPAIDAVRQWQYTPTFLNCTPTDVRMKVTVNFAVPQ